MNSVELFAGAGGLGLGVANAGFKHILVVERDKYACSTLQTNFGNESANSHFWPLFDNDVRTIRFTQLSDSVEFVSGGPPCQPFSIGGKHRGNLDHRDMFPEAARAIRELGPKAFLFENVKGLLRSSFSRYFEYIQLQLTHPELVRRNDETWEDHHQRLQRYEISSCPKGLNYRVSVHLVNAADYGIPQRRERVMIIGFRSDVQVNWLFPRPTHSKNALLQAKYVSGEYWERNKVAKKHQSHASNNMKRKLSELNLFNISMLPWLTVRDAIGDLPDPRLHNTSFIPNHVFQPGAKRYTGHTGSVLDEPAKTLKAGDHGVPGGENMLIEQSGSVRYFTVREAARLQTFPDWFLFASSWTESMRQIGNAVPVRLAEIVSSAIASQLRSSATK